MTYLSGLTEKKRWELNQLKIEEVGFATVIQGVGLKDVAVGHEHASKVGLRTIHNGQRQLKGWEFGQSIKSKDKPLNCNDRIVGKRRHLQQRREVLIHDVPESVDTLPSINISCDIRQSMGICEFSQLNPLAGLMLSQLNSCGESVQVDAWCPEIVWQQTVRTASSLFKVFRARTRR